MSKLKALHFLKFHPVLKHGADSMCKCSTRVLLFI